MMEMASGGSAGGTNSIKERVMKKKAWVVIGAGLGDEGKGLMTDYLTHSQGCGLVVRFNGGAQAGHTVTLPGGERHVFGHFGAGTLAGAASFLSRFFVVNPILFFKESDQLRRIISGGLPEVYVDKDALLTTPWDMQINQILELTRGHARHGSCGIGFGETIERCLIPRFRTTVSDLADPNRFSAKLDTIRHSYIPGRLKDLNISRIPAPFDDLLTDPGLKENYVEDALRFRESVIVGGMEILKSAEHLIFEGAQGLLLDEYHPWFPHVTRSRTGLNNVLALARETGIETLDVSYMTRAYLTRHGAGPLPFEVPEKPYEGIVDKTNIPNTYQGALRFAWLNLDLLTSAIANDLKSAEGMDIRPELVATCIDQVGDTLTFIHDNRPEKGQPMDVVRKARSLLGFDRCRISMGPTRETILQS